MVSDAGAGAHAPTSLEIPGPRQGVQIQFCCSVRSRRTPKQELNRGDFDLSKECLRKVGGRLWEPKASWEAVAVDREGK